MPSCKHCGNEIEYRDMRVSIRGMYDMHLFTSFTGKTVDDILDKWEEHNSNRPHPAVVGDRHVKDLGECYLCPITVLGVNKITGEEVEIRRVGEMVFPDRPDTLKQMAKWRQAALDDPDIPRILAGNDKVGSLIYRLLRNCHFDDCQEAANELSRLQEITRNDKLEIGSYRKRTGLRGENQALQEVIDDLKTQIERLKNER